jgi:hypothetical protein
MAEVDEGGLVALVVNFRDVGSPSDFVQWESIHGRRAGKPLTPVRPEAPRAVLSGRSDFPEQQPQSLPCVRFMSDNARGDDALRSLVACASLRSADIAAKYGAVRNARGASFPQPGHSCAKSDSAIGLMSVKGPHRSHEYS